MTYRTNGYVIHVCEPNDFETEYEVQASKTISGGRTLFAHARHERLEVAEAQAVADLRKRIQTRA